MIHPHHNIHPQFGKNVFVAPNAIIIGDAEIGADSSIWFGVIMRADVNVIRIGERTNIQDGTICHVTLKKWPLFIGNSVTVGHGAMLHGCTIHDYALVGMRATILDGAEVGAYSIVAAGSLVREDQKVPERTLVAGVPAVVKRKLRPDEIENLESSATRYVGYKNEYISMGMQHTGIALQ